MAGKGKKNISVRHDEETEIIMADVAKRGLNESAFVRAAIKFYYHQQVMLDEIDKIKAISSELAELLEKAKSGLQFVPEEREGQSQATTDKAISDDDILLAGLEEILGPTELYDDSEVEI